MSERPASPKTARDLIVERTQLDIQHCSLEVIQGPDEGAKVDPLPEYTTIGRTGWCELELSDPRVSARHCEIRVGSDAVLLRDLASTNGTLCGGWRIVEAYLEPDSVFVLGDTHLRLQQREGRRTLTRFPYDATGRLVGTGSTMQRLFEMASRVADRTIPLVFLGETGTGKTAVARAVHEQSRLAKLPFVSVNCAALPADLVESTLFGHVKGAFTGAHADRPGIFEQARGGTVLLDEIGDMPRALQPKLLQVLEGKKVRPVGGDREVPVEFRLLTATNRPLASEVAEGRFRQDLYYRVAGLELVLPPLRERPEDIPHLARLFLAQQSAEGAGAEGAPGPTDFDPAAMERLRSHPWPGNVRELQNVVARATVLSRGAHIAPEDVLFGSWDSTAGEGPPSPEQSPAAAAPAVAIAELSGVALPSLELPFKDFKDQLIEQSEEVYLRHLLQRAGGNVSRAARIADISRSYLRVLLEKYGL